MVTSRVVAAASTVISAIALEVPVARAQSFDLGLRVVLTAADGTPANDIPGFGIVGHYRLGDRWLVGAAVDRSDFDFEEPAKVLGLEQDPALEAIDVKAEATTVSAWLARTFGRQDAATAWYAGVGAGFAMIDVPDASGPLLGGGTFLIHTEAEDEVVALVVAGVRRNLGSRLVLDFGVRAEQHFADWRVSDSVSGTQGAIDDYLTLGGHLAVGVRF